MTPRRRPSTSTWRVSDRGRSGRIHCRTGRPACGTGNISTRMLRRVHKRLVESCALDCLRERHPEGNESRRIPAFPGADMERQAENFPSVSKGTDVRLESEELIGMALVEDEEAIHLSAFSRQSSSLDKSPRMANYRSRMKHPRRR